jgi:hypothetical protein
MERRPSREPPIGSPVASAPPPLTAAALAPHATLTGKALIIYRRVERALRTATPVVASGIRRSLRAVRYHRAIGRLADGRRLTELSDRWVAADPGTTPYGARQGFPVAIDGLAILSPADVRAAGLQPRATARPGKYLAVGPDHDRAYDAILAEQGDAFAPAFNDADPRWVLTLPDGRGERSNRWEQVRCPNPGHADHHASAGVRWNPDGQTGGFHCFVCRRTDGPALTGIARRSNGEIHVLLVDATDETAPHGGARDSVGSTRNATFNTQGPGRASVAPPPARHDLRARTWSVRLGSSQAPVKSGAYRRGERYGSAIDAGIYVRMLRGNARTDEPKRRERVERAAEAYATASAAAEAKGEHLDPRGWVPDELYTLDRVRVCEWEARSYYVPNPVPTPGKKYVERILFVPRAWVAVERADVMFDFDDLHGMTDEVQRRARTAVERVIALHPDLSGAYAGLVTSWTGAQVLVEVRTPFPVGWLGTADGLRWYYALASALLVALRGAGATGGTIDPTATDNTRRGRLPSCRLTKQGEPFAATLFGLAMPADANLTRRDAALLAAFEAR